jgi:CRISPR-associated protein Cmr3
MSMWIIEPRDPLIFRDGKPFTANPGERSKSLPFPVPSTLAGAVRRQAGIEEGIDFDNAVQTEALKKIAMEGPILAEVDEDNRLHYFFPAAADALVVEDGQKQIMRHVLRPIQAAGGARTDLVDLNLIGPASQVKEKPSLKAPLFWSWEEMEKWLVTPGSLVELEELGFSGPIRENRTHVSIEPGTQASLEGALFQTSGMEFTRADMNGGKQMKSAHPLVLALQTEAPLKEGADFLGGERRVIRWQKATDGLPACPVDVRKKIVAEKHLRVILGTPAYFEKGFLPTYLLSGFGVRVAVQGAALSRFHTISGWDYEKGKPKETRRLVPAGSVYFLKLEGDPAGEEIEKFIDAVWLKAVSDDEQARRDGFGLALLGTWDGIVREMEVKL